MKEVTLKKYLGEEITPEKVDAMLTKVYNRVIQLAQEYPCVKGDYNLLTTYYFWAYYGRKFGIPIKVLLGGGLPSTETICRAFRRAVENGEIHPSGRILKRREARQVAMRNVISGLRSDENGID